MDRRNVIVLRALVLVASLLLIVGTPLAEARGKSAPPPGHANHADDKGGHKDKDHRDAPPERPRKTDPPASPAKPEPAPSMPAWVPPPAPPAPRVRTEPARFLALDMGYAALPTLPPYQTAAFASVPMATVKAPTGTGLPSWTWLLPAIGLVSAGATLLVARKGRAPAAAAVPPDPAVRIATATVPSLLRAGKAALDAGDVDEAIAWFTQATKLDPRLAVAHFSRGVCLASVARHDEAYRALKKAHALDPLEGAYRLELARAGARTGRGSEAMTLLWSLIAILPELAGDVADDDAFASLLDHPRFLLMVGRL